ncbi:hypothetical protein GCM10023259_077990 [Thermocatellispora tengchongensis]
MGAEFRWGEGAGLVRVGEYAAVDDRVADGGGDGVVGGLVAGHGGAVQQRVLVGVGEGPGADGAAACQLDE